MEELLPINFRFPCSHFSKNFGLLGNRICWNENYFGMGQWNENHFREWESFFLHQEWGSGTKKSIYLVGMGKENNRALKWGIVERDHNPLRGPSTWKNHVISVLLPRHDDNNHLCPVEENRWRVRIIRSQNVIGKRKHHGGGFEGRGGYGIITASRTGIPLVMSWDIDYHGWEGKDVCSRVRAEENPFRK